MSEKRVRTRFAPSPTGYLHLGGIRTALYNYLLAKKFNGDFILRIEDTDQTRFVPEAQEYILRALKWLNIEPNEGVGFTDNGFGPYIQSQRKNIYKEYAELLVEKGAAYYAFDTDEELENMHKRLSAANVSNPRYNFVSRDFMKNSLTLPKEEVEERIKSGEKYVIRFKILPNKTVRFYDIVRGWIKVDTSTLDDKVLLKSDGMATYHLASIVDDHLMQISHIIRGEEWLPSAPLHVLMYEAFKWERPEFIHLPLLLKPDGKGKLSKRDADEGGFPIFPFSYYDNKTNKDVIGFKEKGFLPEAIINAVALLGWNPGNNKELFTVEELIDSFSLEKLQKSGARFNYKKFEWFNHQFIMKKSNEDILNILKENVDTDSLNKYYATQLSKICEITKERAFFKQDIYENIKYFFYSPNFSKITENQKQLMDNGFDENKINVAIDFISNFLEDINTKPWDFKSLHDTLKLKLEKNNLTFKEIMPVFRLAIFGDINGPDVIKSIIILGKNETNKRFNTFKKKSILFLFKKINIISFLLIIFITFGFFLFFIFEIS